ncbi:MAG: helix-turn-helix domain-containing protein [Roseiarcus sp.]
MINGALVKKLREAIPLSQSALAKRVGVSQATIADIEKGEQGSTKYLPKLAAELGVEVGDLDPSYSQALQKTPRDNEAVVLPSRPSFSVHNGLPVYASAEGGDGAMLLSIEPIDYEPRPSFLDSAKDAYMMLISGDSMVPAYKPGERVIVDPRLGPIRDEPAIFYAVNGDLGEARVLIKEFIRQTSTHWLVRQFNPPQELQLAKSEWAKAHRVVGKYTRR